MEVIVAWFDFLVTQTFSHWIQFEFWSIRPFESLTFLFVLKLAVQTKLWQIMTYWLEGGNKISLWGCFNSEELFWTSLSWLSWHGWSNLILRAWAIWRIAQKTFIIMFEPRWMVSTRTAKAVRRLARATTRWTSTTRWTTSTTSIPTHTWPGRQGFLF